jgi:hypothetical protein
MQVFKARMTKAEHTLELLLHIPLVTHSVLYLPNLKNWVVLPCDVILYISSA